MFDVLHASVEKIISSVGIIGYKEEDIKKRGNNIDKILPLNCLYIFPPGKQSWLSPFTIQMMFPDNNHKIPCPKFFALTLTDQNGVHSYLYCLKFSEKYDLNNNEIDIPVAIFIKSEKEDLESFKQLLNLINFIIVNDDLEKNGNFNYNKINDYKKVQLMNLFYFVFSLPYTPPHSLIKLKIDKEIKNPPFDSIDFYFSSNCEIPCNKNDTDINILFLLLDQSIIIKVLFSILTEKQIVFRASQAYLLHIIIPSFLKLIFPFKWLHSYITILPKENISLLEAPGSFIFGVLSDVISLQDLMLKYPGKIIVDCDTNEIYGDSHLEPFCPPKNEIQNQTKNKINKKEKENNGIVVNTGNNLLQGNNAFNVDGSYLYKYENDINTKRNKFTFDKNKNNIIIDTRKSQLLVDKTNRFIDSNEWKWLRKNIQLVRNPEIFYLDNIIKKKKSGNNSIYLSEEDEENVVLPNRSFSYNIQNIFMKYILNKLSFTESEFMSEFKNTNLYLSYNEPNKYQNNSGKKIVENILELKNKQRNLDNCFNIEFALPKLNIEIFTNKIDEKLNNDELDNAKEYENIKSIFDNYIKISSEDEQNNNDFYNYEMMNDNGRIERKYSGGRKSDIKKSRISKLFRRGHERNKTSVLQESFSGNNNFLLYGVDNSVKGVFKFYKENGFLEFIHCFEKIMNKENINIIEEIFQKKIYQQILNIIISNEDIFENNKDINEININNNNIDNNKKNENVKNDNNKINIKKSFKKKETFSEKEKNKASMGIILENAPEDEENDLFEGRGTVIQNKIGEEFDFTNNIIKDINEFHESIIPEEDYNIINFPSFVYNKEKEDNDINKEPEINDMINHKMQFLLFIAKIIEEIMKDKNKSEDLINNINKQKNNKISINSLLLRLYRLAFKFSGKKHRDFPYFSYYNFLSKLNLEQLKLLKEDFNDLTDTEIEMFEIYGNVNLEKEKEAQKKEKIEQKKLKRKLKQIHSEPKKEEKIKKETNHIRRSTKINAEELNKIKISDFVIYENDGDNKEFNISCVYVINTEKEFETDKKEKVDLNLIQNIAEEINNLILKLKDININSIQNILDEMNKNIIENKNIINLVSQLKYLDLKEFESLKQRMTFWLNCFNYLVLFTIFYKKWNINTYEEWKYFLRNVRYNINGDAYSFNDIQYLIFNKVLFFQNNYQVNENIKNFRIQKAEDAKNFEKKIPLLYNPFMIYLPIKGFNKPIIYEDNKLEIQINQRISGYFLNYVRIDYEKNIHYHELLINYYPNFMSKDLKKFQSYIIPTIYNFIKDKKYKNAIQKNFEWKLDFEKLFDDFRTNEGKK